MFFQYPTGMSPVTATNPTSPLPGSTGRMVSSPRTVSSSPTASAFDPSDARNEPATATCGRCASNPPRISEVNGSPDAMRVSSDERSHACANFASSAARAAPHRLTDDDERLDRAARPAPHARGVRTCVEEHDGATCDRAWRSRNRPELSASGARASTTRVPAHEPVAQVAAAPHHRRRKPAAAAASRVEKMRSFPSGVTDRSSPAAPAVRVASASACS